MVPWEIYIIEHKDQFVGELLELLRIPSISSLPDHKPHVQSAAEWIAARMNEAGIESVGIIPTHGHPVVYGDWLHAPGKPTVLIYGHFDVQPVDPLELWENQPFEPVIQPFSWVALTLSHRPLFKIFPRTGSFTKNMSCIPRAGWS